MVIGAEAMDAPLHIPWASGGGLLTGHFPLQALAPLLSAVGYAPGAHVPRCVAGLSSTPRATLTQWGESPDSSPSLPPFVGGSGHEATWSLRGPHKGLTAGTLSKPHPELAFLVSPSPVPHCASWGCLITKP